MKFLIIGASGLIGGYVYRELLKKFPVEGTSNTGKSLPMLNIRNKNAVFRYIKKIKPDVVIVTAAITNVDYCETYPELSRKINVIGIYNICAAMTSYIPNSLLIFFSSDYIFDGKNGPYKETDTPHPLNVYGRQKLEAEKIIKNSALSFLIIRTNWVYGAEKNKKNFIYTIINSLQNGRLVHTFSDQVANPTYAGDIVKGLLYLVDNKKRGIYHIAGPDLLSRFQLAKRVASLLKLDARNIVSLPTSKGKQIAKRPLLSGLITKKFHSQTHLICLNITQGVKKMIADEKLL